MSHKFFQCLFSYNTNKNTFEPLKLHWSPLLLKWISETKKQEKNLQAEHYKASTSSTALLYDLTLLSVLLLYLSEKSMD